MCFVFGHYIHHVLYFTCKIVRLSHSFIKGYILDLTWLVHQLELRALSSHPVWVRTPLPWNKFSPRWRRTINSLLRGSTCFDNQLTRPLHAINLLLQYVTEGIHTMSIQQYKDGKLENRQFLAKMHQIAPNCISNSKIFPGVTPPDPHPRGGGRPSQTSPSHASRLDMPLHPRLWTDSIQTDPPNFWNVDAPM